MPECIKLLLKNQKAGADPQTINYIIHGDVQLCGNSICKQDNSENNNVQLCGDSSCQQNNFGPTVGNQNNNVYLRQCCNEDWKWTEDEYEESLVSENRPKNLHSFKNSLNIF